MQIFNIHFLNPEYFFLFLIVPFFIYFYIKGFSKNSIKINIWEDIKKSFSIINLFFYIKIFIIFFILVVFILLFANPNKANIDKNIKKNWIDIVIALDISGSMEAIDLKPNRLEKAKETIQKFIKAQKTNRIWLILFAGRPFSSIPLTFDYNIIDEILSEVSRKTLNQNVHWLDWTAIWDALLMSKNLFKSKKEREKVIILLTDWDANRWVEPVLASKLLAEEKIRVYSIWIWSKKWWIFKVQNWHFIQNVKIPPLKTTKLKKVSKNTWWYFFRATDDDSLEKIFKKLEELEKNDIEIKIKKSFSEFYNIFIYTLIILIWILFLSEVRRGKNN